jgi:phage baseplate assembly protein W
VVIAKRREMAGVVENLQRQIKIAVCDLDHIEASLRILVTDLDLSEHGLRVARRE